MAKRTAVRTEEFSARMDRELAELYSHSPRLLNKREYPVESPLHEKVEKNNKYPERTGTHHSAKNTTAKKSAAAPSALRRSSAEQKKSDGQQRVSTSISRKEPASVGGKPLKRGQLIRRAMAFLIIGAIMSTVIFSYVRLNELTDQNRALQKQLDKLQSDENLLNVQIDRKTDILLVEQIAREKLNMVKLENYQIHYINLANQDKAELLSDGGTNSGDGIISNIVKNFNMILEYLS